MKKILASTLIVALLGFPKIVGGSENYQESECEVIHFYVLQPAFGENPAGIYTVLMEKNGRTFTEKGYWGKAGTIVTVGRIKRWGGSWRIDEIRVKVLE